MQLYTVDSPLFATCRFILAKILRKFFFSCYFIIIQGQPPSGVGQGSVYNYQQPPPPSSNAPPPPSTNLSAGPPPPPSSGAVGGGMTMGLPPPGPAPGPSSHPQPTRISPAPPTSVATMAAGVRQMQLGPPPTGIFTCNNLHNYSIKVIFFSLVSTKVVKFYCACSIILIHYSLKQALCISLI